MDAYTTGFQEHAIINLLKPIEPQLRRRRLHFKVKDDQEWRSEHIRKIIEHNASLRVDFGWSFESMDHLTSIMETCVKEVTPKYTANLSRMVSDLRCSWLGFESHNMYDKEVYKDMSLYSLVVYNNEIIDFQIEIIKLISEHPIYRQHALLRDDWYRFEVFKEIRKDRELLEEKYHYYMDAIHDISVVSSLPRDILEQDIGVHFLYYPDLFFELLEFSILKGEVYE